MSGKAAEYARVAPFKPFIDSLYDPPKAREAAFAQIEAGVDVLNAERAGVVDAAREKKIIAFGNVNDMNQKENGKDVVVTSALWDMNAAISHAIGLVKKGRFKAEDYKEWTMMWKGGGSLAPYYEFENRIPGDAKARVEKIKGDILAETCREDQRRRAQIDLLRGVAETFGGVLEPAGVTKRFGELTADDMVDLSLAGGEVPRAAG